ncbi:MAG: hypothetical protein ACJ72N_27570 [Labedaea sp.]
MKAKRTEQQERSRDAMDRQDAFREMRALARRTEGRTPTQPERDRMAELQKIHRGQ